MSKSDRGRLALMLAQLASHYWRPDYSPSQSAALTADYAEDLADCTIPEIEVAIREYRRDATAQFFPKSGQLRALIVADRKHRADLDKLGPKGARPQFGESRPLCWWGQHREFWKPHWSESQVPAGELCRDKITGKLREPKRAI